MAIPNKNIGAFREMLFSITLLAFYTRPVVFTYVMNLDWIKGEKIGVLAEHLITSGKPVIFFE